MLLELLPGVACAGGMALAMWIATRPLTNQQAHDPRNASDHRRQLAELEEEVARLRDAQHRVGDRPASGRDHQAFGTAVGRTGTITDTPPSRGTRTDAP